MLRVFSPWMSCKLVKWITPKLSEKFFCTVGVAGMTLSLYLSAHFFTSKDQVHTLLLLAGGLLALFRLRKDVSMPNMTTAGLSLVIFAVTICLRFIVVDEEERDHTLRTRFEDLSIAVGGALFYLCTFAKQDVNQYCDLTRVLSAGLVSLQTIASCLEAKEEEGLDGDTRGILGLVVYGGVFLFCSIWNRRERKDEEKLRVYPFALSVAVCIFAVAIFIEGSFIGYLNAPARWGKGGALFGLGILYLAHFYFMAKALDNDYLRIGYFLLYVGILVEEVSLDFSVLSLDSSIPTKTLRRSERWRWAGLFSLLFPCGSIHLGVP